MCVCVGVCVCVKIALERDERGCLCHMHTSTQGLVSLSFSLEAISSLKLIASSTDARSVCEDVLSSEKLRKLTLTGKYL